MSSMPSISTLGSMEGSCKQEYSFYKSLFAGENQKLILKELERTRCKTLTSKFNDTQSLKPNNYKIDASASGDKFVFAAQKSLKKHRLKPSNQLPKLDSLIRTESIISPIIQPILPSLRKPVKVVRVNLINDQQNSISEAVMSPRLVDGLTI